jgi:hypothetical protein
LLEREFRKIQKRERVRERVSASDVLLAKKTPDLERIQRFLLPPALSSPNAGG